MAYRRAQDTKGLRAVFYARVSTAEEEQLNAIELQIEENRNTITKHGWKKVDEYIDRSKSGTMVKGRDEYQRLYEDLLGDAFDVVVIKDQERLMRNTLDWYLFINRLVQTGKILYMYLEDKFYSPDDALITGIKAIIAEEFSRNLSKKLHNYHDGRIEKARQGLEIDLQGSGNVFGWDKVDGKYVINPEQAKVRRLMCEGIMARKGSTQIAKELNDAGYRNTVGKPWKPMDIPKFVYDCKNVGTMIINRERHDFESKQTVKLPESEWVYVKGALPPIVTEEEWALIEKIHEERVVATGCNRRGKKTSGYSFSGKLVCGVCGAPYWRKTKTSNEEYWVCSTKQQKGRKTRARDAVGGKAGEINPEGCDNENISYNALMEIMAIVSERLQADTGFIREFMLSRLDTYEKRITEANRGATEADLQREISRKDKLLDAYLDSLLTKEEYQRKAQALDEHILELKREVEANKANLADLAEIQRVRENIDAEVAQYLDENEQLKVEFVLEHLSQVIIYPDKVLVIFDVFGEGVMVEKSQYVSRQKITVNSGADGIDSNGNLYVTGGTAYINGPESGGDGALDYNGTAEISGGVFAAVGSSRMMQSFSSDSEQKMIYVFYEEGKEAGTFISLTNADGDEVFSWTPEKTYECLLLSLPEFADGDVYRLVTGEEETELTIDGTITKSGQENGGFQGRGGRGAGGRRLDGAEGRPEGEMGEPGTFERPEGETGDPGAFERPEGEAGEPGAFEKPEGEAGDPSTFEKPEGEVGAPGAFERPEGETGAPRAFEKPDSESEAPEAGTNGPERPEKPGEGDRMPSADGESQQPPESEAASGGAEDV